MNETCPKCKSNAPHMVGIINAFRSCRDAFHCPTPDHENSPFRYCPNCDWTEPPTPNPLHAVADELRELAETFLYDGDSDSPRPGYDDAQALADRIAALPR